MKEIMINSNRANNIITRDIISLDEAISFAKTTFIVSIIYRGSEPEIGWLQLIIVGDDDGVVAIPRGRFNDVLALAAEKDEADERRKERIKAFFKDNPYNNQQHDPTTLLSQDIQKLLHK